MKTAIKTAASAIAVPFVLLLACSVLQGCDRRQTDGHSATPPEQGAATEAPAEAPADQSVQPAAPPPADDNTATPRHAEPEPVENDQ
ncbi:MAG TPA: hypothetical protein VHF86_08295 [Xanthomonadaceae bacterium]|jgi:hypothetical protein|nr:hypothetical protein [Xanthomonadaceae bacterium]